MRAATSRDEDRPEEIDFSGGTRGRFLVNGDRTHLLPIGTHQGIAIVTARELLERIEARLKT